MALAETLVKYHTVYNAIILRHREATASATTFKHLEGHVISHGSQKHIVSSGLSEAGRHMVCCHLINDNQEFEDLVRSASNLSEEEKEKYIGKLYHDCGISSSDLDQYRYDDT